MIVVDLAAEINSVKSDCPSTVGINSPVRRWSDLAWISSQLPLYYPLKPRIQQNPQSNTSKTQWSKRSLLATFMSHRLASVRWAFSYGLGKNMSLEEVEPVLLKAIELRCTFWDTAVIYRNGVNEKFLGDLIRKHNVRHKVFGRLLAFRPL